MKPPSKKRPKPPRRIETTRVKSDRTAIIIFKSQKGERMAATLTAVDNVGFDITGARRIITNMTLFSPDTSKTVTFTAKFDKAAATPPKAMTATLTRELPGGAKQSYSLSVSAKTAAEVFLPGGAFSGRSVGYEVDDTRTLTVNIRSLDGYGVNEIWHLDLNIIIMPGNTSNFEVRAQGSMSIDSVTIF